jgi:poly(hydroxyalkanoate) granule-associated protein
LSITRSRLERLKMVKKFKAAAEKATSNAAADSQLASAIKDSAQQIWLAGLGAFAKAQEEGTKVFEVLVKEGTGIQKRTKKMAEARVDEVTSKVTKVTGEISKQANEGWDKLEQVFEDRVARALKSLGVPSSKELQALVDRVEALSQSAVAAPAKAARKARAPKSVVAKAEKAVAKAKTRAVRAVKATEKAVVKAARKATKAAPKAANKAVASASKEVKAMAKVGKRRAAKVVEAVQATIQ